MGPIAKVWRWVGAGRLPAQAAVVDWKPTHCHSKGGLYREMTRGVLEATHEPMVIYDDAEGTVWVRPVAEFDDGRFTRTD